jgi:mannose-binding lectin
MAMYAQTSGTHSTTSGTFEAIPGLSITIPEGVGAMAIVILNLPQPYSTGNNYPGGVFRISIDGKVNDVEASFTYSEQNPPGSGRAPTTLLVGVPLGPKLQVIQGLWHGVRGSKVIIDSPATLTAILD